MMNWEILLLPQNIYIEFKWASSADLNLINNYCLRINDFMQGMFRGVGIKLVDFKLEFGKLDIRWKERNFVSR